MFIWPEKLLFSISTTVIKGQLLWFLHAPPEWLREEERQQLLRCLATPLEEEEQIEAYQRMTRLRVYVLSACLLLFYVSLMEKSNVAAAECWKHVKFSS